jgi:predicted site-specific integrase-resolvase
VTEIPKTQEEAARIIGVKPTTLSMWRHKGKGPIYIKVGRSCFYRESDIERWLDAQAVIPIPKTEQSAA